MITESSIPDLDSSSLGHF
ncbi:hypothetical protein TNCV_1260071, partial [Trichonephila clavipes]